MPQDAYVAGRCSEIECQLRYAAGKSSADPELGAYLAGYVSILISGVVENCIEHMVVQRARRVNDTQLQEFVRSSIARQFRNPRSQDIANMLAMFSHAYRSEYQSAVSFESREALGSVMANRISLAHQGSWQQPSTVSEVKEYFSSIIPILDTVERILLS